MGLGACSPGKFRNLQPLRLFLLASETATGTNKYMYYGILFHQPLLACLRYNVDHTHYELGINSVNKVRLVAGKLRGTRVTMRASTV